MYICTYTMHIEFPFRYQSIYLYVCVYIYTHNDCYICFFTLHEISCIVYALGSRAPTPPPPPLTPYGTPPLLLLVCGLGVSAICAVVSRIRHELQCLGLVMRVVRRWSWWQLFF